MSTILIVENDPVLGAVLEDRFHFAGHEVELLRDRAQAAAAAAASPVDLMILEIGQAGREGLELVGALRQRPETRSLPILVLSESVESADRVAALRAGADDYLTKPCDLEELMLRAERLVAGPQPVLQGDLASHPLWELVQFLQQARQSGSLALRSAAGNGRVRFAGGRIRAAKWAELPPAEALLAVFGLKQGSFRFAAERAADAAQGEPLATQEILMEAAWLEDELEKRRDDLPATGAPLTAAAAAVPAAPGDLDLAALPVDEIYRAVSAKPGIRLFDLMGQLPWAPQKIRLAVAWLVEHGALTTPAGAAAQAYPDTVEITSAKVTELAMTELLAAARAAGFGTSALPFLLLVEAGNWPALIEMLAGVPGYRHNDALRAFTEHLRSETSGSVTFPLETGKLVLHVRALEARDRVQIETVATVSAGVLLWLDAGAEPELVEQVIERLEAVRTAARGVAVAVRPEAAELARRLTRGKARWQVSSHAPQSLLGVLRLLQPHPGG